MSVGDVRFLYSEPGIQFKLNCLVPDIVQLGSKEKAAGVNSKLQVSRNTVGAWEDCAIHIENLTSIPRLLWPGWTRSFLCQRKFMKREDTRRKPSPAHLGCCSTYEINMGKVQYLEEEPRSYSRPKSPQNPLYSFVYCFQYRSQ